MRLHLLSALATFLIVPLAHGIHEQQPTDAPTHRLYQLYHSLQSNPTPNMETRLTLISKQWLQTPYELFPLGEGNAALYDDMPRYRFDAFDCETYVDTVLAIAFSTNLNDFKQCIDQIRYANGNVSFYARNHFTSIDWNTHNQQQGFLKDITETIKNQAGKPIAMYSRTRIDKAKWYKQLPLTRVRLLNKTSAEHNARLRQLKQSGRHFKPHVSTLAYIPLSALFDAKDKPILPLFNQIPNASIIEIVRPNWDLTSIIGTPLDVSHLGFVFRENGILIFRQASSIHQRVIDVPLIDYLHEAKKSPTIGGINIQMIVPQTPFKHACQTN